MNNKKNSFALNKIIRRLKILKLSAVQKQTSGSAPLILIFIGLISITIAVGVMKNLSHISLSDAHLIFSRKALFAAESGIEQALLKIKKHPVQSIKDLQIISAAQTNSCQVKLNITNNVQTFTTNIAPLNSLKLNLPTDIDSSNSINKVIPQYLNVSGSNITNNLLWKLICQKNSNTVSKTTSIQNLARYSSLNILNALGKYDDINGNTIDSSASNFLNLLSATEKNSCFIVLKNTSEQNTLEIKIQSAFFSPPIAKITSRAICNSRQKNISFSYSKNNIESLFDFGLLHQDRSE